MDIQEIHPHLKLIETVCLKRCRYLEEGHECYIFVLSKLRENDGRRIRQYQGKSAFKTYVIAVTHRLIIDFIRQRRGRFSANKASRKNPVLFGDHFFPTDPKDDRMDIQDPSAGPEELLFRMEAERLKSKGVAIARELIKELASEDQLVLKMRFEDGLKISTIAKALGLNQRALYGRVKRLMTQLKTGLLKKGLNIKDVSQALAE